MDEGVRANVTPEEHIHAVLAVIGYYLRFFSKLPSWYTGEQLKKSRQRLADYTIQYEILYN